MSTDRLPRHQVTTRYLRVPTEDWAVVRQGIKTEFRTRPHEGVLTRCSLPTPVVAYCPHQLGGRKTMLLVLEERRYEPLFYLAEDPEGLAREGFETYGHFRTYWRRRTDRHTYRPMTLVWVWRVRPWQPSDLPVFGESLLRELYGEHL